MEWLEKEDLRAINGCNLFRACIEDCSACLFRTLETSEPDDGLEGDFNSEAYAVFNDN